MTETSFDFDNAKDELERVVITGAKGYIGSTVGEAFLSAGCTVVGWDIDLERDGELFPDPQREGLYWRRVDMTSPEQVRRSVESVRSELGSIDAVIHFAGGFRWSRIEDVTDEQLDFLLETNLRSALLLTREVIPGMRDNGFGRVVLMSTQSTLNPGVGEGPYTASKAGLNTLTKSVAAEVKEDDITVNALLPSVVDTEFNRSEMPDADFSKWVDQEQIAEIAFRLTQSFGDPINGALIPVAGGM